jgi:hypothetical protein
METTASSSQSKLYCPLRKVFLVETPEERVRMRLISSLLSLGYPASLLIVERQISQLPHLLAAAMKLPKRRVDIICYAQNMCISGALLPLLLVECKAGPFTAKDRRQLFGYNLHIGARFFALANSQKVELYSSKDKNSPRHTEIPSFDVLLQYI